MKTKDFVFEIECIEEDGHDKWNQIETLAFQQDVTGRFQNSMFPFLAELNYLQIDIEITAMIL